MATSHAYEPDYYDRLGLDPSVDDAVLQRQYRLLAKLFHPDVSTHPDAHKAFLDVREAYDVLSDTKKRAAYDAWLEENVRDVRPFQVRHVTGPQALRDGIGAQRLYVLLDVQAALLDASKAAPLNLVVVLDRSSSMRGERLYRVRQATQLITDRMDDNDTLGIVTFNDRARVILRSGSSPVSAQVKSALDNIVAEGGTEIGQGLAAGIKEVLERRRFNADGLSHVILLTDGQTYGDEERCLKLAQQAATEGVGLTLFGVGTDWNDTLLDEMAERANGYVRFISDASAAVEHFEEEILRLQRIVAQDADVVVQPAPETRLLAVHEVAPGLRTLTMHHKEQETLRLGNLPISPPLQLLFEFQVTPTQQNVALAAHIEVRAQPIDGDDRVELPRIVVVPVRTVEIEDLAYPDAIVDAARRVTTLGLQAEAWSAVDRGDVTKAVESLSSLATRFLELGETDLAAATQRELSHLQRTGTLSAEGNKAIKYGTRRLALPPPSDTEQ